MSEDRVQPASRVAGEIRVEGMLRLAPDTLYESDVHAPGGLVARPGSIVVGDVYTDGPVQLAATARIGGRVRPSRREEARPPEAPGTGCLERLLVRAENHALSPARLEAGLAQLDEALREPDAGQPWSHAQVREDLVGRGLARLTPVTIERDDDEGFLLRIRDEAAGRDLAALTRLTRQLCRTARPESQLSTLSAADTPGDVVLLVDP
jgi:hypothetical protein